MFPYMTKKFEFILIKLIFKRIYFHHKVSIFSINRYKKLERLVPKNTLKTSLCIISIKNP